MNKLKTFFKKFLAIDDSPHKIALGAGLGIFFGIMPGEGVATTLVIATILRANKISATAGVLATNMWTTLFVLPFTATVGGFLFGISAQKLIAQFHQSIEFGWRYFFGVAAFRQVALPLLSGFVLVSGASAIFFYLAIYLFLKFKKPQIS